MYNKLIYVLKSYSDIGRIEIIMLCLLFMLSCVYKFLDGTPYLFP